MKDMKIYKPRMMISRYYTILFSLPKWQILVSLLLLVSTIQLYLLGKEALPIIINSSLVIVVYYVYSRLNKTSVFYKLKRIVGLSLATMVYTALYTILTRDVLLSTASSASLLIVVTLGLDGTSISKYLIASSPVLITITILGLFVYYGLLEIIIGFFVVFVLIIIDFAIYRYMARRRVGSISLPDLGTLFLRNWLDKRTDIESAFEAMGDNQYVNPRLIELGDLILIHTDVHYGPFSNIGSSILPVVLEESFRKIGYRDVITLHGLGSHDRNLVSSRYRNIFLNNILNALLSGERSKLYYLGSFVHANEEWRSLGIVFDKLSIIIVSRCKRGIDDLPYIIQEEYELKARKLGLHDVVILDSHNWELVDEPNLGTLRELLDAALMKIKEISYREPVEILHKHECFETRAPGLVNGYGCVVCITGENREESCIVYLRGNNMKPGVRDILIERSRFLGTPFIEVLTNDEHTETGTRKGMVYIPVHDSPELLETIENVAIRLREKEYSKGAWLYSCKMNLKLMGDSIEMVKKQLASSIKESAVLLMAYVFGTPLILSMFLSTFR